jgi:hypothetical protein
MVAGEDLRAKSYEENNSAEHRLDRTEEKRDLCAVDIGVPRLKVGSMKCP